MQCDYTASRCHQDAVHPQTKPEDTKYQDDQRAASRIVESAERGSCQLTTGADEHVDELIKEMLQYRQATKAEDPVQKLDGLNQLLARVMKEQGPAMKRSRWRIQFLSHCIYAISREYSVGKTTLDIDKDAYRRRTEASAIMLNQIVGGLVPHLGAYALVAYSALEGECVVNYCCSMVVRLTDVASTISWVKMAHRSVERRRRVVELVVEKLLGLKFCVQADQLWFNPAVLVAWFTGDR